MARRKSSTHKKKPVKCRESDKYKEYQEKGYDSPIEYKFDECAKKAGIHLKKDQQIKVIAPNHPIRYYKPDFYIETDTGKYIIELDGRRYHSYMKDREYDYIRQRYLTARGYTVVRFTGREVNQSVRQCVDELIALTGHNLSRTG